MKNIVDIFVTLGERLRRVSTSTEGATLIDNAIAHNAWFTPEDIRHAIMAICDDMLECERLTAWVEHYALITEPKDVAVIMAGNIPLVGFNDLLCVLISGHRCHVKPSSKDSVLMRYVIDELRDIDNTIAIYDYERDRRYDMAIATGGDEANRYFEEHFATTRRLLRSSRHSLAVLDGMESNEELDALTRDITLYSGLGCRSVSMVLLPRDRDVTLPMCRAVNTKLEGNIRTMRALMTMQGRGFRDQGGYLIVENHTFPTSLATVSLGYYDDTKSVKRWIAEHRESIQCVVSHADIEGSVPFGHAQRPTLWDYADGIDTMKFLRGE